MPHDRVLRAEIAGELAGAGFAFPWRLRVPGGTLPCAAVSGVGVRADMRRRGVLRSLMTRLLADSYAAGEAVAALWASEGAIYGRYGFGMAAARLGACIPRLAPLVRVPAYTGGVRQVPIDDALPQRLAAAYAAAARPGFLDRDAAQWALRCHDPEHNRKGATGLRCLVAGDPDAPDGYALWAVQADWGATGPQGQVLVREILSADPGAYAALWRFLSTSI